MSENNHWVTSVLVTIVHSKEWSPDAVRSMIADRACAAAEFVGGGSGVIGVTAVGTHIEESAGEDIPDWYVLDDEEN